MVEGDRGHQVVADVCTDDIVEEMCVDEPEIAIDGSSCAASECPRFVVVMRHRCVGVLEEGDGHCFVSIEQRILREDLPIQLFTHSHGTPQRTITFQLPKIWPATTRPAIMIATPRSDSMINGSSLFLKNTLSSPK